MSENTDITVPVEVTNGQIDLFTNEAVEVETVEEMDVDTIVAELVEAAFGTADTITAYKIASIINGTFKVLDFDKQIPPQMMYNYNKNGLINGIKDMKQKHGKVTVIQFVTKYVNKQINK
jgi:hypothetical protein